MALVGGCIVHGSVGDEIKTTRGWVYRKLPVIPFNVQRGTGLHVQHQGGEEIVRGKTKSPDKIRTFRNRARSAIRHLPLDYNFTYDNGTKYPNSIQ